jgi:cytochrome P450
MRTLPPRVPGWPLVGSLPQLARRHLDFLLEMRARYGDVFTVSFGSADVTILAHPRHAEHVLRDHADNYQDKGGMHGFRAGHYPLMSTGLATVDGRSESWRRQRRVIQPALHPQHMDAFTAVMVDAIAENLARWPKAAQAQPVDLEPEITRMTMDVIGKTMFGTAIEPHEADRIAAAVRVTFNYAWQGALALSLPGWMPVPGKRRYDRAIAEVNEAVGEVVERSLRSGASQDYLIGALFQASRAVEDEATARAYVHTEALTLLITGYESTAAALSWAFSLLSQHPSIYQRLLAEVDTVLAGRQPVYADLAHLPYARMVMRETLRLYAPSHWIQRQARDADEIDGFTIPAGAIVAPMIHLIHHNPNVWDDPPVFAPERFTPEGIAGRHKLAWIPFGVGQRMCPAEMFSIAKGQLILAQVLQRYNVTAAQGRLPQMQVGTNVRPKDGVWAHLAPRGATS